MVSHASAGSDLVFYFFENILIIEFFALSLIFQNIVLISEVIGTPFFNFCALASTRDSEENKSQDSEPMVLIPLLLCDNETEWLYL